MDVELKNEFFNTVIQLSQSLEDSVKLNTLHTLDCALHFLETGVWPCEETIVEVEICSSRHQKLPSCNFHKIV